LTQLVAIGHMRKCPKNQIGTHYEILLKKIPVLPELVLLRRCSRRANAAWTAPYFLSQGLDAQSERIVQKSAPQSHIMKRTDAVSGIQIAALETIFLAFQFRQRAKRTEASIDQPQIKTHAGNNGRTQNHFTIRPLWMALLNL
jgi:hypothetical protein